MRKFIEGLITGVILTLMVVNFSGYIFGETYTVKSIKSHYPQGDNNSSTTLIVYIDGSSGHTKEVLCEFPPSLELKGNNETGWSGLKKVKIMGEAHEYLFSGVSYYAEKLE